MTSRPVTFRFSRSSRVPRSRFGVRRFFAAFWQTARTASVESGDKSPHSKGGYTLVEILVAATLSLVLMGAVVTVFSSVGSSINNARAAMETKDRVRAAAAMLRMDLEGVTVTMLPPRRPEAAEGYFEYIEGATLDPAPVDSLNGGILDNTAGQRGDILMFTTRNSSRPFVGRGTLINSSGAIAPRTLESDVAEVAWFLRGRTLHRRVLLVAPGAISPTNPPSPAGFYAYNDVSVRFDATLGRLVGNTLADLTKRENRFAHPTDAFPFDVRRWGQLGLPTLRECSSAQGSKPWAAGMMVPPAPNALPRLTNVDLWRNNDPGAALASCNWLPDDALFQAGYVDKDGTRVAEDVVLTNVIGFDVKAWDSGAPLRSKVIAGQTVTVAPGDPNYDDTGTVVGYGAYVDLGCNYTPVPGSPTPLFWHYGTPGSQLQATSSTWPKRVYDTWSFHYVNELPPNQGRATNGFDDDNNGIVDDGDEATTDVNDPSKVIKPPYPVPLRGIQVRIRVFEPDSRQVWEVTVMQDFLPK
jgi:type II secretory pathway component PulJ